MTEESFKSYPLDYKTLIIDCWCDEFHEVEVRKLYMPYEKDGEVYTHDAIYYHAETIMVDGESGEEQKVINNPVHIMFNHKPESMN